MASVAATVAPVAPVAPVATETTDQSKVVTFRFTKVEGCDKVKKQKVPEKVATLIPFYVMATSGQFREAKDSVTINQETTQVAIGTYLLWKAGNSFPELSLEVWADTVKLASFLMDDEAFVDANPPPEFTKEGMEKFCLLPEEIQVVFVGSYLEHCTTVEQNIKTIYHVSKWEINKETDKIIEEYKDSYGIWIRFTIERRIDPTFNKKMTEFCSVHPLLAKWIWENVDKGQFLIMFKTPNKRHNRMSRCSFEELVEYIEKFLEPKKVVVDEKEQELKRNLKMAKGGARVGRFGRYINSDDVELATRQLAKYRAEKSKKQQQVEAKQRTHTNIWTFSKNTNVGMFKELFGS